MQRGIKFGDFVRASRKGLGISLRQFCKDLEFDPGYWSKVENSIMMAPREKEKLELIADFLGVERNELIESARRSWIV